MTGLTKSDQATFPVTVGPDLHGDGAGDASVVKSAIVDWLGIFRTGTWYLDTN